MLPFQSEVADDEDPLIMVRIIPELKHIFKTKERVPFKIVVETVKYSEIRATEEGGKILEKDLPTQEKQELPEKNMKQLMKGSTSHIKKSQDSIDDGWENVSNEDLKLDGMNDPFAESF